MIDVAFYKVLKGLLYNNITKTKTKKLLDKKSDSIHAHTCTEMKPKLLFGLWDYKSQVSLESLLLSMFTVILQVSLTI